MRNAIIWITQRHFYGHSTNGVCKYVWRASDDVFFLLHISFCTFSLDQVIITMIHRNEFECAVCDVANWQLSKSATFRLGVSRFCDHRWFIWTPIFYSTFIWEFRSNCQLNFHNIGKVECIWKEWPALNRLQPVFKTFKHTI